MFYFFFNSIVIGLYFLLDWIKWDCVTWVDNRYNSLISGWLLVLFFVIQSLILVFAGVINIIKKRRTAALIVICFCLLPFVKATDIYSKLDYFINRDLRENIVSLIQNDQVDIFCQTDVNKYVLPVKYRRASLTSQIFIKNEGALTVFFDVQKGLFGGKGIVYTSDCKPYKNALGIKFKKVKEIKKCWYYVSWK